MFLSIINFKKKTVYRKLSCGLVTEMQMVLFNMFQSFGNLCLLKKTGENLALLGSPSAFRDTYVPDIVSETVHVHVVPSGPIQVRLTLNSNSNYKYVPSNWSLDNF